MIFLTLYLLTCILWGLYAIKKQYEQYPNSSSLRIVGVCVLNILICPIAIIFAFFNDEKNFYVIYEGSVHEGGGIWKTLYFNFDDVLKKAQKIVEENQKEQDDLYKNKHHKITLPYDWKRVADNTWTNGLEEVKILKLKK